MHIGGDVQLPTKPRLVGKDPRRDALNGHSTSHARVTKRVTERAATPPFAPKRADTRVHCVLTRIDPLVTKTRLQAVLEQYDAHVECDLAVSAETGASLGIAWVTLSTAELGERFLRACAERRVAIGTTTVEAKMDNSGSLFAEFKHKKERELNRRSEPAREDPKVENSDSFTPRPLELRNLSYDQTKQWFQTFVSVPNYIVLRKTTIAPSQRIFDAISNVFRGTKHKGVFGNQTGIFVVFANEIDTLRALQAHFNRPVCGIRLVMGLTLSNCRIKQSEVSYLAKRGELEKLMGVKVENGKAETPNGAATTPPVSKTTIANPPTVATPTVATPTVATPTSTVATRTVAASSLPRVLVQAKRALQQRLYERLIATTTQIVQHEIENRRISTAVETPQKRLSGIRTGRIKKLKLESSDDLNGSADRSSMSVDGDLTRKDSVDMEFYSDEEDEDGLRDESLDDSEEGEVPEDEVVEGVLTKPTHKSLVIPKLPPHPPVSELFEAHYEQFKRLMPLDGMEAKAIEEPRSIMAENNAPPFIFRHPRSLPETELDNYLSLPERQGAPISVVRRYDEIPIWDVGRKTVPVVKRSINHARDGTRRLAKIGSGLFMGNEIIRRTLPTQVARSRISTWGLFALTDIEPGEFICAYTGEIIDEDYAECREERYLEQGMDSTYLFMVNNHRIIDATVRGGKARFINHSCDPNCRPRFRRVEGIDYIGFFALREIKRDEELTFDYQLLPGEDKDDHMQCLCGSENCRGWLY